MAEQLRSSIDNDTDLTYYDSPPDAPLDAQAWIDRERESAHRDVGYRAAEYEKEVERCNGRTAWVRSLRESL